MLGFPKRRVIDIFLILSCYCGVAHANPSTLLNNLEKDGIKTTALFVNLTKQEIIMDLHPEARLTPASLSKLVVGATALEKFGAQYSFTTRIYQKGKVQNGVLDGDLVLVGSGDPYLTNEKLWFLSTDVFRSGIKAVTGDLIVDSTLFDTPKNSDKIRLSAATHSTHAYDSPLSAAAVNFSVMGITATPNAQIGEPALVGIEPYPLPSVKIINKVTTIAGTESKLTADRKRADDIDIVTVSGVIGKDSSMVRIYRSVSNAEQYTGEVVAAFLKAAGVKISGSIKILAHKKNIYTEKVLAQVDGYPMDLQLAGLFKMSNNFIGDTLALHLKKDEMSEYLKEQISRSKYKKASAQKQDFVLQSGSGLTYENRLSASDIVSILEKIYSNSENFPTFLNALPMAGKEGTVKTRFQNITKSGFKHLLRAKTGTLTQPTLAIGLAGYGRLNSNGDWIAFAVICNEVKKNNDISVHQIRAAIDKTVSSIIGIDSDNL